VILAVAPTTREHPHYLRGGLEMVAPLPDFLWMPFEQPCWHCGEPTTWIDIGFETALHPGECSETKWGEFWWQSRISWLQGPEGQAWIFENFGAPPRG
jgi:hypothetical protein